MAGKDDRETFAKLLIGIGGLLAIYAGITMMISLNVMAILYGLVVLLLGIAALMSAVKPGQPIPCNIVVELIIGIIILWLTWLSIFGTISAILIIIGGILLAID